MGLTKICNTLYIHTGASIFDQFGNVDFGNVILEMSNLEMGILEMH